MILTYTKIRERQEKGIFAKFVDALLAWGLITND
jgi:hypothetical protein